MTFLKSLLLKRKASKDKKAVQSALALQQLGEGRNDGLTLVQATHHLEIEWRARDIHPWDRACEPDERELLFSEQSIADTDAALSRLFNELPAIDVIEFKVTHPDRDERILGGKAERSRQVPSIPGASARARLWHKGVTISFLVIVALSMVSRV